MPSIKFLFDEDVTIELVRIANDHEHWGSRHVNDAGLNGRDDVAVLDYAVEKNLSLVTENARDFRRLLWRAADRPGRHELHPGLVIIENGNLTGNEEIAWFSAFLARIKGREDLINKIFEIHSPEDIREFERPPL